MTSALFTDFYALTMAQGYWKNSLKNPKGFGRAAFEMFFRKQPFGSGFSVFAGLGSLLEALFDKDGKPNYGFSKDDIAYLHSLNFFESAFLDFLEGFRFTGSIYAMDEGRVVFPQEPLIRIEGGLVECQILEAMLLNMVNFQTLIATKAARVHIATGMQPLMEFGLRRAQGPDGGLSASRAAFIGGAGGTSNVLAAKKFGIPPLGTMAHAWVMSFPSELDAFRAYAELYPDNTIFLIDTYDTLKSGLKNAIIVGKELQQKGKTFGVRLDSGDMAYLTRQVRRGLDDAGLKEAFITVSNDLDESIIQALRDADSPIDSWGVGTQMVTGGYGSAISTAAFTGVYKLMAKECDGKMQPTMKLSDNPDKTTTPGIKQVWRLKDAQGMYQADIMALDPHPTSPRGGGDKVSPRPFGEGLGEGCATAPFHTGDTVRFWHPSADYRRFTTTLEEEPEPLIKQFVQDGKLLSTNYPSLQDIQARVTKEIDSLDTSYKRILNPHIYKVSITEELRELKLQLIRSYLESA
ncbi:MAG: nicotinate phosphoribosyltransferase [Spirochaetaceae bacterium]|jgi:nicotinate phosphoribosyltransferase|nr:nicotinate phosphoribosyltransferase [Spirochaetaceae bacterium]